AGSSFAAPDITVAELLARRAAHAIENARSYEREHAIAQTLQRAFLPATLPPVGRLNFDAVYAASTAGLEVGGDWYDAFGLPDGRCVISIGDVCGHGLNAAALMGKMRLTLRTLALIKQDPLGILNA